MLGYYIVKALLEEQCCTSIHVFSRDPSRNRQPTVHYHAGSLTSKSDIEALFSQVRPNVVFHVASPVAAGNTTSESIFFRTNVEGTKNLLSQARSAGVQAFVYTSTVTVMQPPYVLAKESQPLISKASGTNYYSYTKALADAAVLAANDRSGLKTACLRITTIYGECDSQLVPETLQVMKDKRHHIQIGPNQTLFDFVSARNAANAHILCAENLLQTRKNHLTSEELKVDGEAFFVTDGSPILFWDFERKIWSAAGDTMPKEKVRIIPIWFVLGLAIVTEWIYWIITLGTRTPRILRSYTIEYVTKERTFSIDKARARLGYTPSANMDEELQAAVDWQLRKERRQKDDASLKQS